VISAFDDYCVHQAPGYLRVPGTTDRNFYDRYFFSGYKPDGSLMFGIAFGRYPNRFVQDAHFTVALNGTQYSLHASDTLGGDPAHCQVGPIEIKVVEPMRVLSCSIAPGDSGISGELFFRAETGAIDEGRLQVGRDGINWTDQTRFMQYGQWSGWIEIDGERIDIDPGEAWGLRDKSWGIRLIGDQHATLRRGDQIFWMNVVLRLENDFGVIRTLDLADGSSHEREGYTAPLYPSPQAIPIGEQALRRVKSWDFDLDFATGTRRIATGHYQVEFEDGTASEITGRTLGSLWYAGIGYHHEYWQHGRDHGEGLSVERETWVQSEIEPGDLERQFLASVMEFSSDGKVIGFGHTEQLLMGAYEPLRWGADQYSDLPDSQ